MTDTRKCYPWALVLLLFVVFYPLGVDATTFARLSIEDMTALSSHAVTATCKNIESRWDEERTTIVTRAEFDVEKTLHGGLTQERISVYLPGGTVGEDSVLVIGAPEIKVGDEAVLMLQRVSGDTAAALPFGAAEAPFGLVGLSQGVFKVERNSTTNEARAVSSAMPIFAQQGLAEDALPPGGADGMPLAELEERIRAASRLESRERGAQGEEDAEMGEGAEAQTNEGSEPPPPQTVPDGLQAESGRELEAQEEEGQEETGAGPGDTPERPVRAEPEEGVQGENNRDESALRAGEEMSDRAREAQETEGQEETGEGSPGDQ